MDTKNAVTDRFSLGVITDSVAFPITDDHIRKQALDIRESFIVQAPAGSGKTTLLTKRLLRLLAEVEKRPEECLAITFTRKAAAEMRTRLLEALEFAETNPPPLEHNKDYEMWFLAQRLLTRDKKEGWNLLKNPSRLRIQTVDSLCANIARQMPILSQFGASPTIVEDPEPLYREAALELLLNLKMNNVGLHRYTGNDRLKNLGRLESRVDIETESSLSDSIAILLKHLDNNLEAAERLLAEMLSFREQWLPHIGLTASIKGARNLLEKGLQIAIQDNLRKLIKTIPHSLSMGSSEILVLAKYAAEELKLLLEEASLIESQMLPESSTEHSPILACAKLNASEWPGQNLTDLPLWQGIATLLLTEDSTLRKAINQNQGFKPPSRTKDKDEKARLQFMKQRIMDLLKELESYPNFCEALKDLRSSPTPNYTDAEWEIMDALVKLLPALVAELSYVFQKTGQVDFAEVLLAASRALGFSDEPSDLALKFDNQLRHILVDEFQDISIPQLKLLEQLTFGWEPNEGRSLFLVGDPQQSIYRFRQAEVGLFLQVKEKGIGAIQLTQLNLSANFRSSSAIVNWVNQFFAKTFPAIDEVGTGAVAYSPSISAELFSGKTKIKAGLDDNDIHNIDNRDTINAIDSIEMLEVTLESEATALRDVLIKTKERDPNGTIALLVRSRNHLQNIIPMLKQAEISYYGLEIEPLKDKMILQDLLTLTKALLHLGDRVAWLSLLRAPYCNISLNDLFILANHESSLPLCWTLSAFKDVPMLSDDAINKLRVFIPILEEALADKDRFPLSVWISNIWRKLIKLNNDELSLNRFNTNYGCSAEDVQVQETFFAILEEAGYCSDFYDVELLEKRLQVLYAKSMNADPKAVQIMTIHKSKGLEFDTVIVAGISRTSRSDSEKLLLWESRASLMSEPYLILAPIKSSTKEEAKIYSYLKNENKKRAHFEAQRLLYVAATRAKKQLFWLQHTTAEQS